MSVDPWAIQINGEAEQKQDGIVGEGGEHAECFGRTYVVRDLCEVREPVRTGVTLLPHCVTATRVNHSVSTGNGIRDVKARPFGR